MQMQIFTQFEIPLSSGLDRGHNILINSLESFVGICDVARLVYLVYYQTKISFSDQTGESSSSSASVTFSVLLSVWQLQQLVHTHIDNVDMITNTKYKSYDEILFYWEMFNW